MAKRNPLAQKLVDEYRPLQTKYQGLAELIGGITGRLAKKVGRKYQMVGCRAKDVDKLYEKIIRKKKEEGIEYKHLDDIEDLAGARIIFYFESDRKAFIEDLQAELGKKTILSTQEQIKANGYRATHIILSLDDSRTSLPEYSEYTGMKCELQVTSTLYHAWSEVEHDITYKPDGNRDKLIELGLDRLESKFKELHEHIEGASIQLDLIREDYEEIREFGNLLEFDLVKQVTNANNDKAWEILNLIKNFYNKKPEESFAVVEAVFQKEPLKPEVLGLLGTHEIMGKTHSELEAVGFELLAPLIYYKPHEAIKLLLNLFARNDATTTAEAKKVLEKFSKYDYGYIKNHRNYGPQLTLLECMYKWDKKRRLKNFVFVETASHELLGANIEGTEWTKPDTLTRHSMSVSPTQDLQKIRTKVLNMLEGLFYATTKTALKLKILNILQEASRGPDHEINLEVSAMIAKDAAHVLRIYKKAIFAKNSNRLKGPLSIITEIESRLYWWGIWKLGGADASKTRKAILSDGFYKIARLMIGDPSVYYAEDNEAHLKGAREEEVQKLIADVKKPSLEKWYGYLNRIAGEKDYIDLWKFNSYRTFLTDLSQKKPNVADSLLALSLREGTPLSNFSDSFLEGFRLAGREKLWDKYSRLAPRSKNIPLTRALINSLYFNNEAVPPTKTIRIEDITLLTDIVYFRNGFEFLNQNEDRGFQVDLFRVICSLLQKVPKRMEPLFRSQMQSYPDLVPYFIDTIGFFTFAKSIEIDRLTSPTKAVLKRELIKIPSLEWRAQDLLLKLTGKDLELILDVFASRIRFEERYKKDRDLFDFGNRYDAVPYHLNPELAEFISKHPKLKDKALEMLDKMTQKWSLYNWDITHLFERIGSFGLSSIVEYAIKKGDQKSLLSAAHCLSTSNGTDLKLCMKVIANTSNKKVISLIDMALLSTGVVSGEYGLAEAYKNKADLLKPYLKSKNQQVRIYAKKLIASLEKMSLRARRDASEEHKKRELRFDAN